MHVVKHVNGRVLWANTHLLFWLSLIPFVTGWMGENHFDTIPVAVYGFVLFMAGIAYFILAHSLLKIHAKDSTLAQALGNDFKGKLSVVIYLVGIILTFFNKWLGVIAYASVAAMWLIPDSRIEKRLVQSE